MRLDHLLSKEHLPAKVGKGPASPNCVGVGCSSAETLASRFRQRFLRVSTAPVVGCGKRWRDAAGGGVKQTPCWVLKEQAPLHGERFVLDGRLHLVPKLPVVGVLETLVVWVVVC